MSAYSAKAPGPPDGEPSTRWPVLDDLAAQLDAGGVGQRRLLLVDALRHQDVGEVQRRRPHLDQHLALAGVGWSTSSRVMTFEGSPSSCTRHARMRATLPDEARHGSPASTRSPWRWPTVS